MAKPRITVESINAVQAPPPTPAEAPVVKALQQAIRPEADFYDFFFLKKSLK